MVMAPMTRSRSNNRKCSTALTAQYYEQRATAGLIEIEGTLCAQAVGFINVPGIYSEAQTEG
jgi:N-ethylmaleimide reductase